MGRAIERMLFDEDKIYFYGDGEEYGSDLYTYPYIKGKSE